MLLGKIEHPDHGDITMDVARELALLRQEDERQIASEAEARQALIASVTGQEARTFKHGHMVAQIDGRVHDYWRRREGPGFWRSEMKYMLKRHPELRVISKSTKPSILVTEKVGAASRPLHTAPVRGKRGRWAA